MFRTSAQQYAIDRKKQETRNIQIMGGGAEVAGAILAKSADDDKKRYDSFINAHGVNVSDDDLPDILRADYKPDHDTRDREGYEDAPVSDYPKQINLDGSEPHQLSEAQTAKAFILAGNAYFTVRSLKTGVRYTYRVAKAKPNPGYERTGTQTYFVSYLTGPENTSDYTYLGMIRDGRFSLTRASKMNTGSTPVKAFDWVWRHLAANQLPPQTEIWHEGRCGRCGRTLTVPESIAAGIGPECAGKM